MKLNLFKVKIQIIKDFRYRKPKPFYQSLDHGGGQLINSRYRKITPYYVFRLFGYKLSIETPSKYITLEEDQKQKLIKRQQQVCSKCLCVMDPKEINSHNTTCLNSEAELTAWMIRLAVKYKQKPADQTLGYTPHTPGYEG